MSRECYIILYKQSNKYVECTGHRGDHKSLAELLMQLLRPACDTKPYDYVLFDTKHYVAGPQAVSAVRLCFPPRSKLSGIEQCAANNSFQRMFMPQLTVPNAPLQCCSASCTKPDAAGQQTLSAVRVPFTATTACHRDAMKPLQQTQQSGVPLAVRNERRRLRLS